MSILDEIRKMPEHLMKDDDHPFWKDITREEALEALNESYERTKHIKAVAPDSPEEKESRAQMILNAMNRAGC